MGGEENKGEGEKHEQNKKKQPVGEKCYLEIKKKHIKRGAGETEGKGRDEEKITQAD